jgi:hypothetical protein
MKETTTAAPTCPSTDTVCSLPVRPSGGRIDPETAAELLRLIGRLRHPLHCQLGQGLRSLLLFIEQHHSAATPANRPSEGYPTAEAVSSIRPAKDPGNTSHEDARGTTGNLS